MPSTRSHRLKQACRFIQNCATFKWTPCTEGLIWIIIITKNNLWSIFNVLHKGSKVWTKFIDRLFISSVAIERYDTRSSNVLKAPSNETPAFKKSVNMDIRVVGTSNQIFLKVSETQTKFSKNESSYWQNSVLCNRSILYNPFCLSLHWLL